MNAVLCLRIFVHLSFALALGAIMAAGQYLLGDVSKVTIIQEDNLQITTFEQINYPGWVDTGMMATWQVHWTQSARLQKSPENMSRKF